MHEEGHWGLNMLSERKKRQAWLMKDQWGGGKQCCTIVKVTGQNPSGLDHKNHHKIIKSRGPTEQSDKVRVRIIYLLLSIPFLHKPFSHFSSASSHPPPIFRQPPSLHTLYCCTFHCIRESGLQLKLLYVIVPIAN